MATPAPLSLEAAYLALDPQEALDPEAGAYTARPVAPLATLATQLRLGGREGTHLVSGHIGSGKTTELRRVAEELDTARASLLPLDVMSRDGKMTIAEIADALREEIRISTALDKATPRQPPIVLLDGLDKLSLSEVEPTLAWLQSLKTRQVLVLTVPLSYLFTPSFSRREGAFAGVHVVPALPVVNRDLQANPDALAWFEKVLVGRGVRGLFDDDAVAELAMMTAGIIRDFVRSCREAVLAALVQGRSRVDLEVAKTALAEFALRMSRPVSGDDLRVLNVVAETGRVVGHSTFLALIDGGQIVEYRNGSNWYAVHPLLRDIVARFAKELAS